MVLAFAVVLIGLQVFTGIVWWSWVRRASTITWTEALGMGLALGSLLSLASALAFRATPIGLWGALLPPIIALIVLALARTGRIQLAVIRERPRDAWWAWGPATLLGLLTLLPSVLRAPITDGYVSGSGYSSDLVFQESVSRTISLFGAGDNILLAGEPLKYHWFVYGWAGVLTELTGSVAFVALTRIVPVLLILGCAWLAAAWARQLSSVRWVPGTAALLVVGGAYLGAQQGVVLAFESPSNGYATILLLAFALVMTLYLRGAIGQGADGQGAVGQGALVVVGVLAIGVVGAKVSQAAVLAAGLAVVLLGALLTGRIDRGRALALTVTAAVGMGLSYALVLAGIAGSDTQIQVGGTADHASTYQGLDAGAGMLGILIGTAALVLAAAPRWAGLAFGIAGARTRWTPETLFGIGLVLASIGTLVVLRSGTNAAWFALAATAPLAVIATAGAGEAWQRARRSGDAWADRRLVLLGICVGAIAACGVVLLNDGLAEVTGAPVRWRGPFLAWIIAGIIAALTLLLLRVRTWRLWAVILVLTMSAASLGARFTPVVWQATAPVLTPPIRGMVLRLDPGAEFPQAAAAHLRPARTASIAGGRVVTGVRAEAPANPAPGVAYSLGIIEWTPVLNAAALQLREASAPDDVIASDSTLLQPFLPIMTGRRMLLAGQPYVDGYTTSAGLAAIDERRAALDALIAAPSAVTVSSLRALGVRWLWLQQHPRDQVQVLAPFATVLVVNDEVAVLDLGR